MDSLEIVTGPVVTQTGTTTSGSAVVTGLTTSALAGAVFVSGTGIPPETFVQSIDSASQVTLTAAATATGAASLTFGLEPITLREAKKHLRVDIDDDDALIASYIDAARLMAEVMLRQTLLTTTYDWFSDGFPASANGYFNRFIRQMGPSPQWLPNGAAILYLDKPPLVSVASVKYLDPTGAQQTYDPTRYTVTTGMAGRVQPTVGNVWPVVVPQIGSVVVRYTAGKANASLIPENVKAAAKLLVAHYYENRELTPFIPDSVTALLSATRQGSYA